MIFQNAYRKVTQTIVGGGGGGRPDSATAGAKKPEKLDEALSALPSMVEKMI